MRALALILMTSAVCLNMGCRVEQLIFPIFEAEIIDPPPVPIGPFAFEEQRIEFDDLGDGVAGGVTVFQPTDASGPRPALVWVLGINNRAHYHQSLHEHLASQGFVSIIPDTRDFSFLDVIYHQRSAENAVETYNRASRGELGVSIDSSRIAFGGYSIGATMAVFAAAAVPDAAALVLWAPTGAPYWTGVTPELLYPEVKAPVLFVIGELDPVASPTGFPSDLRQGLVGVPSVSWVVIDGGTHLFFQQPSGVDDRITGAGITRREQQAIAIGETRDYLEETFGIDEESNGLSVVGSPAL